MSDNRLTSMPVTPLTAIPGLESLDLALNRLTGISYDGDDDGGGGEMGEQVQFKSLQALNLSRNAIESIDGAVFSPMRHLVDLDLSHNQLPGVTDAMLSSLRFSLNGLNLSHNRLTSIQPLALQHLQHLRVLSLAHNPLKEESLRQVVFPAHLASLDLSHCTLTIVDHCQLSALQDLAFIGLRGNHLTCTCQLYLLLQWYQDQHHKMGPPPPSSNNWTCTLTTPPLTPPSSSTSPHLSTAQPPGEGEEEGEEGEGEVRLVSDLGQCRDTQGNCQTLEHGLHHLQGSSQIVVSLDVVSSGNILMASWTYQASGGVPAHGFRLHYMPEDSGPIDSPLIAMDLRSFVLRPLELEQHFKVCLDVVAYGGDAVLHQQCRDFEDESRSVIAGVLAAVVFLTPCIIILAFITVKDRMVRKEWSRQGQIATDVEKLADEEGCCLLARANSSTLAAEVASVRENQGRPLAKGNVGFPHTDVASERVNEHEEAKRSEANPQDTCTYNGGDKEPVKTRSNNEEEEENAKTCSNNEEKKEHAKTRSNNEEEKEDVKTRSNKEEEDENVKTCPNNGAAKEKSKTCSNADVEKKTENPDSKQGLGRVSERTGAAQNENVNPDSKQGSGLAPERTDPRPEQPDNKLHPTQEPGGICSTEKGAQLAAAAAARGKPEVSQEDGAPRDKVRAQVTGSTLQKRQPGEVDCSTGADNLGFVADSAAELAQV